MCLVSVRAILTNVGHSSYAAKLALEAKAGRKKQQTTMMKSLDNLVKIIGIVIVPLGIIMYVQSIFPLDILLKQCGIYGCITCRYDT